MKLRRAIAPVLSAVVLVWCGGCALIAWPIAAFSPPEMEPAVYEPPRDKTYLVFVDDVAAPVEYEGVKRELTEQLGGRLEEHKIASRTIDYGDMVRLVSATPNFQELAISEVGRQLGADIVVYVQINRFELYEYANSSTWNGLLEASVRVVDVKEQKRLWPQDRPAGWPLDPVHLPQVELETRDQASRMARMLAERAADRAIRLFVEHPKPSVAEDTDAAGDW